MLSLLPYFLFNSLGHHTELRQLSVCVAYCIEQQDISEMHKTLLREEAIWFKILMGYGGNRDPNSQRVLPKDVSSITQDVVFVVNNL